MSRSCDHDTSRPYPKLDVDGVIAEAKGKGFPVLPVPCHAWGTARYSVMRVLTWWWFNRYPPSDAKGREERLAWLERENQERCLPPLPRDALARMLPQPRPARRQIDAIESQHLYREALADLKHYYGGLA